ncbi:unnamed protein product [Dimorphilus gyrociliatus]|uniref:Uncharacterized protein n=1 Tax=Dimorphilus gyrociliatus TaxID=2664684 RepID=A0A7I8VCX6_9ANNE|nr:unnamed protein product [Dimorphilus gyrociliatus]
MNENNTDKNQSESPHDDCTIAPIILRKEHNIVKHCLADCTIISTVSSVCNIYFWIVKNNRNSIVEVQCNSSYGYHLYHDNEISIIDISVDKDLYVLERLLDHTNIRRLECVQANYQLSFIGKVEANNPVSFTCINDGFLILCNRTIYKFSRNPFEKLWLTQLPFEGNVTSLKCEKFNLFVLCEDGHIFYANILTPNENFFQISLNFSPFFYPNSSNPTLPLLDSKEFIYNQSVIYVIDPDRQEADCYSVLKLYKSFKIFGCARFERISLFYIVQEDDDIRTILTVSY